MIDLPMCLIIGTGGMKPERIIQGIVGDTISPSSGVGDTSFYSWDITTKYYTATINLCSITDKIPESKDFSSNVNAAVIYFNSSESKGLEDVEKWLPFIKECKPEVQILVCNQCSMEDDSVQLSKYNTQLWCLKHKFELVELDPSELPDPDDDFPETTGIKRIIQALHAHSWPNIVTLNSEQHQMEDIHSILMGRNSESSLEDCAIDGSDCPVDVDDEESFEKLFEQLSSMKNQASALEGSQRKAYAEKVTMAFWRAIKGDEQEIEGLGSQDGEK